MHASFVSPRCALAPSTASPSLSRGGARLGCRTLATSRGGLSRADTTTTTASGRFSRGRARGSSVTVRAAAEDDPFKVHPFKVQGLGVEGFRCSSV
jgi:hypothetical protein